LASACGTLPNVPEGETYAAMAASTRCLLIWPMVVLPRAFSVLYDIAYGN